jgi:hypothetical protein
MVELDSTSKPRNSDETLRSIEEWIAQQGHAEKRLVDTEKSEVEKDASAAPNIEQAPASFEIPRVVSPNGQLAPRSDVNVSEAKVTEFFVGKGLLRGTVSVILIAFVVVGAWKIHVNRQNQTLTKASSYLTSLFSVERQQAGPPAQSSPKLANDASPPPGAMSAPEDEVSELKQQVVALIGDLDALRRDVERLTSKNDQLARDIAAVQATAEQTASVSQPAPPPSQTAPSPAQTAPAVSRPMQTGAQHPKRAPKVARVEAVKSTVAAPIPVTTPAPVSSVDQPPRPPLPVPSAGETPPASH